MIYEFSLDKIPNFESHKNIRNISLILEDCFLENNLVVYEVTYSNRKTEEKMLDLLLMKFSIDFDIVKVKSSYIKGDPETLQKILNEILKYE